MQRTSQLLSQLAVLHRTAGLTLELIDARLDLADEHAHAVDVLARLLQLLLRVFQFLAIETDIGRLLDERAPVLGPE